MGRLDPGRLRLPPAVRLPAAVWVLLALGACRGQNPMRAFDAGHDVHVILRTDAAPESGLRVRTVCTVGDEVARTPTRRLGGKSAPRAVHVASLRVPRGKHRFSCFEERTGTGARTDLEVDGERWVVVEMVPGRREARLRVYDRPPHDDIGAWRPLVAVPD